MKCIRQHNRRYIDITQNNGRPTYSINNTAIVLIIHWVNHYVRVMNMSRTEQPPSQKGHNHTYFLYYPLPCQRYRLIDLRVQNLRVIR